MVGIHYIVRHLFFASLVARTVYGNDPMAEIPTTPKCQQCKELVETGATYPGNTIRLIEEVVAWQVCRDHCTLDPTCKFWVLRNSSSTCALKTAGKNRKNRKNDSGYTSGTQRCNISIMISATADFTQSNLCGFKAPGLKGYRLENGDFIFSWQRGSRRMVLTDNQGHVKKWGAVQYGVTTWQDPSTWITYDNRRYTVTNFKLVNQSCPVCTEYVDFGTRYTGDEFKKVEGVLSFTECKNLCTEHDECEVWTLNRSIHQCKLKKRKIDVISDGDIVSGTRACFTEASEDGRGG